MSDGVVSAGLFKFGDVFDLDLGACELRRSGQPLRLGRIPMEMLLLLVEQRGQLVTRERIIERVWGKDVFLDTDNSINAAIRKIRQVLEDDPEQPRFVQTLIGRGYRFIAQVEEATALPAGSPGAVQAAGDVQVSEGLAGKRVSHYRILQLLGGGGMGLVYVAEDLKLGRRVAIKFLPEELADNPVAFERVQREARAASALDHPNICSIYELGEHQGEPFIVMQLLDGQTLRDWIEAASTLNVRERTTLLLDLAMQIADGLEAAHQNCTIHRDIKPANIFVTSQGQAKILDFGVAQLMGIPGSEVEEPGSEPPSDSDSAATADVQLTNSEASVGTPSYLSPEQIQHRPLDARTDLFSFGLVLYEMATGQKAFSGNTVKEIRDAVLQQTAVPPRKLSPDLPAGLETIITKCLEKDPSARYQSAADVRNDLAALTLLPTAPDAQQVKRAMVTAVGLVLVLLVLLGTNIGGIRDRVFRRSTIVDPPRVVAAKARPSVAVLGFKNLSGKEDQAWISTALSEMLDADLASGQKLRLVAGENVARMKVDLTLPAADSYSADTLSKIRRHLHSDMVVMGSYLAVGEAAGGKIRVNLQVQDAKTGETVAAVSQDGSEADLADLVSRSGDSVRQILQIGSVTPADANQVRMAIPGNPEAARLYAQGLVKLRSFDVLTARDLFQKAIAAEPKHALSHAALSECWSLTGYETKAQEEGKKAFELSTNLSHEEQLAVEGSYRRAAHEWPRALEIYRMLWEFFPDNLDYGLSLARVQASAGMGKESMATVEALSKSPVAVGGDPRIDFAEAAAADKLSDLRREEAAAARAVEKGQRQGTRILTANALMTRGSALSALGEIPAAIAALKEAQALFSDLGDRQGLGKTLNNLGIIERHRANLADAQNYLQQAMELFRQTGSKQGALQAVSNLGNVCWDRGDLACAMDAHQQSLRLSREINDKLHEATALGNIAGLQQLQGKLSEARQTHEESLRMAQSIGDREGVGMTLGNIADLLVRQGDLPTARTMAEDALKTDRESGVKYLEGYALFQLAEVLVSQGDIDAGRTKFQESVALRHQLGDKTTEAETQLALAQLQLDTGDAKGAEAAARNVLGALRAGSSTDDRALTYSLLAVALVEQGKAAEAQQAAAKSSELLVRAMDLAARIQGDIDNGYVAGVLANSAGADGRKTQAAANALESAREKSNRFGYAGLEFGARLRLAKLELRCGQTSGGRTHLEELQRDARAKGFLLIAQQAADALHAEPAKR